MNGLLEPHHLDKRQLGFGSTKAMRGILFNYQLEN